jgi:hypothetical protein
MVLGEALQDASGDWHGMAGLLGLRAIADCTSATARQGPYVSARLAGQAL